MRAIRNVSRRGFLKSTAAAGFIIGLQLPNKIVQGQQAVEDDKFAPNLFVRIDDQGTVTIIAPRPDMGQAVRTALPQILADELEADWDRIEVEQALADVKYGPQGVGASDSVRDSFMMLRQAGAAARQMLVQAAANEWGVDAGDCEARMHKVYHPASGRSADYGELAMAASTLPVPDADSLTLKDAADFRYIGQDMEIVDLRDIVRGKAQYGIDTVVPGMKYASVVRCPVFGGKVKSFDDSAALDVAGVERVFEIEGGGGAPSYNSLGGVAVVANSTWAAKKGADALSIEWDMGPNAVYNSDAYKTLLQERVRQPGKLIREQGDVEQGMASAAKTVEAEYYVPHLVHATMEPMAAVAHVEGDKVQLWMPTQDPQGTKSFINQALGFADENITINCTLMGGGFGRKSKADFGVEAVRISREIGAPVKVTWSRENEIQHGYYHAVCAQRLRAGLDHDGRAIAWHHCTAFPSIGSTFQEGATYGLEFEINQGVVDVPFDIPNIRCENAEAEAHVRIGWFRSVCNINHAFAFNSFVSEMAEAAGADPGAYLLQLMGEPRYFDPSNEKTKFWNYGKETADYPFDTGRLSHVIRVAMDKAGWGRDLPKGHGLGVAAHRSFLTYVAAVVEVAVDDNGDLSIPAVHYAVDCGLVVNPDRIRAQVEGGAVYGVSLALNGEITMREGAVEQSNFHDYEVCRIDNAPEVHVHIIESDEKPTGIGEPPVPPFAPALINAIHAATGKRIRTLPIRDQLRA